ncbi:MULTISPECIES: thioredoxin domain-containing protein [unclassified Leifsonia]|uniref:thioredoxin domain-containing protein n=1 Tax=unclassified Leifsonia TaxID=2663824 RepID=UPI000A192E70|nr:MULTISPECIES: thioredoxin domain-containing protein [unclassified Leifsonia]QIZ98604.1 thioredoxin [Leifsonia sp. PS1209]
MDSTSAVGRPVTDGDAVRLTLYTSAFCEPCMQTRAVLAEAARLVPLVTVTELDVARNLQSAEADRIRVTPTVIVATAAGDEVFRAEGVPTLQQVLVAAAKAV